MRRFIVALVGGLLLVSLPSVRGLEVAAQGSGPRCDMRDLTPDPMASPVLDPGASPTATGSPLTVDRSAPPTSPDPVTSSGPTPAPAPSLTPYDAVILAEPDLVAYWPLSETAGTTAADLRAANDGTIINGPTLGVPLGFAGGDVGMRLHAVSCETIRVPNSAAYQFGKGDWSMEAWFSRRGDQSDEQALLNRGDVFVHGFEMYLGDHGAYLSSRIRTTTVQSAHPAWEWGDRWHHAVVTMDRDGMGRVYIDGRPSGQPLSIAHRDWYVVSEDADLYLGSSSVATKFLNGGLAKVALYDAILSPEQVAAHYAARLLPVPACAGGAADGASPSPCP